MSERLAGIPGPLAPTTIITAGLLVGGALLIGTTVALDAVPWPLLAVAAAILLAAVVLWPFGRGAPLLAILALLPLFPVTTIGPLTNALGGRGDTLRAGFIGAMLLCLLIAHRGRVPQPPRAMRPLIAGLLVLAGLGAVAAAANAGPRQGFASLAGQLAGQPLVFAALLIGFSAYLRTGEKARERLLTAFSIGIVLQAAVIAVELLSGGAYDELRGFTRAQGTVGADFVSTLGMIGFLVGLGELARRPRSDRMRLLGGVTVVASLVILVGAVARGGVLGALIGGIYILFADPRLRRRAPLIAAIALVAVIGSLLTPVGHLWTDRLSASSVQSFDRPATWVSGMRMGLDNVWTGLGEQEIERALRDVREYRQTPFGDTHVLPHNSWILVFAEGGIAALAVMIVLTVLAIRSVRAPPRGRGTEERFYVAALIGMAAVAMINNVFRHPELMAPILMLISLLATRSRSELGNDLQPTTPCAS